MTMAAPNLSADRSVSVVVPTHNRPVQVNDAVRSIVEQEHTDHIEVIVVFDGCAPYPITIEEKPGRSIRTLVNTARRPGLAGARNTGILGANMRYLAFCDDDDTWMPDKLKHQFSALREFDGDAVCTTGSFVEGDAGTVSRPGPDRVLGIDDFVADRIMELASGSILLPRSLMLGELGLIDEDLPGSYAEDYDLLLRASRLRPVVNVPMPLVKIAFHGGSFYVARWQMIIEALTYLLDKHPEFSTSARGRARILGQIAFAQAAMGSTNEARTTAIDALRLSATERRAFAALLASSGIPADRIAKLARRFGHGI